MQNRDRNMRTQPWRSSCRLVNCRCATTHARRRSRHSDPTRRWTFGRRSDCKNIQLVGIAAHGGHRRRRKRHQILDAPPAAPRTVLHAALPRRGVDPSIAADHEHIQLVRGTREGCDRHTGRRLTACNGPPSAPGAVLDVPIPRGAENRTVGANREDIQFVGVARNRRDI